METNTISLINTGCTRMQGEDVDSTLDIIISNHPDRITNVQLQQSCSDHQIISFQVAHTTPQAPKRAQRGRRYKAYSTRALKGALNSSRINRLLQSNDPNYIAEVLVLEINAALDIVAPFSTITPRKRYAPHLQASTKLLMTERDKSKQNYLDNRTDENHKTYKNLRNRALKLQRADKKVWAVALFSEDKNDSKTLWNAVGAVNGTNKSSPLVSLKIDGIHITKPSVIAASLNQHFVKKVDMLVESLPPPTIDIMNELRNSEPLCDETFELKEVTLGTVRKLVNQMKKSKANGADSINQMVLSDALPIIENVLVHLINISMCTSTFPKCFKKTKIIPILKAGKDRANPASYRPVSSLCLIGKLIESSVFDQIMAHVKDHGLIENDHHGGRAGHSTSTCIVEVLDTVQKSQDNNLIPAVLAVDLSAAYNLVNHDILLERMRLLSLSPHTLDWVSSFLRGRTQVVEVEGSMSSTLQSGNCGVVQGGKSSGDMFTIYLNDLPRQVADQGQVKSSNSVGGKVASLGVGAGSPASLQPSQGLKSKRPKKSESAQVPKVTTKLFVDDVSIVAMGTCPISLTRNLQISYDKVAAYLTNYRMVINGSKTQLMVLGAKTKVEEIVISAGGAVIHHQEQLKLLGVTLSANSKFDYHVAEGPSSMVSRIHKRIGLLKCIRPYVSKRALASIGGSLINSIISYGAGVWGQTSNKNYDKLQAAQLKVARVILNQRGSFGRKKMSHRQDALTELKWLNVNQLEHSAVLNLTKAATAGLSSAGLNGMFKVVEAKHPRGTPQSRIECTDTISKKGRGFRTRAVEYYNNLPPDLTDPSLSPKMFKSLLKKTSPNLFQLTKHG